MRSEEVMMWISVIAAIACFAVGTLFFMPMLRDFEFYRPLAIYFIFEGCWMIINWAVLEIFQNALFMLWVQYVGTIVFAGYLIYSMYIFSAPKKNDNELKTELSNETKTNVSEKRNEKKVSKKKTNATSNNKMKTTKTTKTTSGASEETKKVQKNINMKEDEE